MLLTLLGIYWTISLVLFLFPSLIWRRKKHSNKLLMKILQSNKILNIAHRGGPKYTTENTIQAFLKVQKVCNCIQMDVCQTADKILVVHHDHHLKRTCGLEADIQAYNYEKLPPFGEEIVLDFGFRKKTKSNKQKIPKLEDIFNRFPNMIFNIQLKTPTQSAMVQFIRLIHQHNRLKNTIVGTRNETNDILKKRHPQILNFMNDRKVYILLASYLLGFVPLLKIQQTSLQIPVYSKQYQQWNVDRTTQKDKWKIKAYMRVMKILNYLTRPLLWHLKRRGIITMGWVCNTEQAFQNAVKNGFQAIMTDDPFLLQAYLKQRNLIVQN